MKQLTTKYFSASACTMWCCGLCAIKIVRARTVFVFHCSFRSNSWPRYCAWVTMWPPVDDCLIFPPRTQKHEPRYVRYWPWALVYGPSGHVLNFEKCRFVKTPWAYPRSKRRYKLDVLTMHPSENLKGWLQTSEQSAVESKP